MNKRFKIILWVSLGLIIFFVIGLIIFNHFYKAKAADLLPPISTDWYLKIASGKLYLENGGNKFYLDGIYGQLNTNYKFYDPIPEKYGFIPTSQFRVPGYSGSTLYVFNKNFYKINSQTAFIRIWILVAPPPPTDDIRLYTNIYYIIGFYRSQFPDETRQDASVHDSPLIKLTSKDVQSRCTASGNPSSCGYLLRLASLLPPLKITNLTLTVPPGTSTGYPEDAVNACKDKKPARVDINSLPAEIQNAENEVLVQNHLEGKYQFLFPDQATQDRIYQNMVVLGGYKEGGAALSTMRDIIRRYSAVLNQVWTSDELKQSQYKACFVPSLIIGAATIAGSPIAGVAAGAATQVACEDLAHNFDQWLNHNSLRDLTTLGGESLLVGYYATKYKDFLVCLSEQPSIKNNPELLQQVKDEIATLNTGIEGMQSGLNQGLGQYETGSFWGDIVKNFTEMIGNFMQQAMDWVFNHFVATAPL